MIPADILLLHTSAPDGVCFVETANLDGETTLKQRRMFCEVRVFGVLLVLLSICSCVCVLLYYRARTPLGCSCVCRHDFPLRTTLKRRCLF